MNSSSSISSSITNSINQRRRKAFSSASSLFTERMAKQITTAFLSDNDLTTCRGLDQFPHLRTLSLSNNLLSRLEDLEPLTTLPHLDTLLLEGNPLREEQPNYRLCVCGLLPKLKHLDKIPVSAAEREAAPGALKRWKCFLDQGLKQVCEKVQVLHLTRLLGVHGEMSERLLAKEGVWFGFSSLVRGGATAAKFGADVEGGDGVEAFACVCTWGWLSEGGL